ncbi:hypothetical protein HK107_14120 [Parvularcula sp. ZS-1/3]|uniref:peptidylprolyl isomerase n=1 Tax=Parvularcula mediterranea TaxID=2732508 RepID=A0A7Y3W646_9PROT|nr:FKBP-type peptidyl-prolyl cis-trans isomerase [Parvularcula mediterranea]NNU17465.1 hypothetical protein [Parvularcula mediterranea]
MKQFVFLSAAVSALALAACGGGDTGETGSSAGASAPAASSSTGGGMEVPAVFANTPVPEGTGEEFLTALAAQEGATTAESGLVILTLEEGTGLSPRENDLARIHFTASVAGSDEPFESSWSNESPVILVPAQTLPGWAEALQAMKVGGKVRAGLPPELAFGANGMPGGPVGPNEVTIFDIELLDVYPADDDAALDRLASETEAQIEEFTTEAQRLQTLAQQQFAALAAVNGAKSRRFVLSQAARAETEVTPTGLVYEVVTDGGSEGAPAMGDTVTVHYRGTLPDGTEFDSSYSRGEPTSFELGRVIEGWNQGLQLMQPGDTYRFYMPAELSYGARGNGDVIGPNQALVFDIELISVTPAAEAAAE